MYVKSTIVVLSAVQTFLDSAIHYATVHLHLHPCTYFLYRSTTSYEYCYNCLPFNSIDLYHQPSISILDLFYTFVYILSFISYSLMAFTGLRQTISCGDKGILFYWHTYVWVRVLAIKQTWAWFC